MNKRIILLLLLFSTEVNILQAQLKFIIEDFEGLANGKEDLKKEGIFNFGNSSPSVEQNFSTKHGYSGDRALKIQWKGNNHFGGWGKGIGLNVELYPATDYLNFYVYNPSSNGEKSAVKIVLEEDDNDNNTFEAKYDDSWSFQIDLETKDQWQLISIPLNKFKDKNEGGDGTFNANYKNGKLCTFILNFLEEDRIKENASWYFDFLCFSKGKLPLGKELFDPPPANTKDYCILGAWSEEGSDGNVTEIAKKFEANFKDESDKKLGVVHFFKLFSDRNGKNIYPNIEKINSLIYDGYLPMITLEDHFYNNGKNQEQPNLYSIVEGHLDYLFIEWAKRIKQVNGTVLLRILHEFNGDWYPWCIANNDKNPQLYIQAYKHIWNIFNEQKVSNVKFVWCPNSMSSPQASWNKIIDAYPGDLYVDYVALDVYNGAREKEVSLWKSFRREIIENYFLITQYIPYKPLLIAETSCRERKDSEIGREQDKAGWIMQMSEALKTDLSKVRLLSWFNQYDALRVNSSVKSKNAYLQYIWCDDYFKSGSGSFKIPKE